MKHIHFIGIGGIGMSGLAKIMRQQGYIVSGCDTSPNSNTQELEALDCSISPCHNGDLCSDKSIDLLVHTTAVKYTHSELVAARARGVTIIHRSQLLAELTRTRYSICVSGSHGKTTTTSLITHIMQSAQRDITFVIGGNLHAVSSNAQHGSDSFLVTEADESDRSLLNLFPTVAVVTNSDFEHVSTIYKCHSILWRSNCMHGQRTAS
jgi:UDP-N-acetylmuramate--alanine ligase